MMLRERVMLFMRRIIVEGRRDTNLFKIMALSSFNIGRRTSRLGTEFELS